MARLLLAVMISFIVFAFPKHGRAHDPDVSMTLSEDRDAASRPDAARMQIGRIETGGGVKEPRSAS